jgi:hypothetical protein
MLCDSRDLEAEVDRLYDSLDPAIAPIVRLLILAGVETFESCQGGPGHTYPEPAVRFHGQRDEGFRAFAVAMQHGLPVLYLRRIWPIVDGEPTGPWWELVFAPTKLQAVDQSSRSQ